MSDELPVPAPEVPLDTPWYSDKSVHAVLTFVVGLIANAVGRKWGYELNVSEIVAFAAVIIGFIGGHKWKSASVQKALVLKAK